MKKTETPNEHPGGGSSRKLLPVIVGIALAVIICFLLITRFNNLDHQAYHHDESIHCYYSWKIAKEGFQTYKYDPVYHGPFLYHFGSLFQHVLPDTNWMARVPFSLIGVLAILMLPMLRRFLGWGTVLILMALMTLSPIMTYYTRFARNDMYMTTWMIGMIVFGIRYLLTQKVRYLTIASVFLALTYCTKENSYVNNFALCSFLIIWGIVRLVRSWRVALQDIFVRYLPLTRLLILFGLFSFFTFMYVAIDSRIGPETGLMQGLKNIAAHATSVTEKTDASVFANETGYFTADGRESVKLAYFRFAFGITLFLLLLADAISFRMDGKRPWPRVVLLLIASLLFYFALVYSIITTQWPEDLKPDQFMGKLVTTLLLKALLLFLVSGIFPLADYISRGMFPDASDEAQIPPPSADGTEEEVDDQRTGIRFSDILRLWRNRVLEYWGLILQIVFAQALFLTLFTSVGTNAAQGVENGLYGYLAYWFKHQTGDYRIWGAWWYYIPRLFLYELLPILAILGVSALIFWRWLNRRMNPMLARSAATRPAALSDESSTPVIWKPVPLAFMAFAIYLLFYMIDVYALLNEKVAWLATYQAFAVNLLAGLLLGHFIATAFARGAAAAVTSSSQKGKGRANLAEVEKPAPGRYALAWVGGIIGLLLLANGIGQHIAGVFVRPDYGSEIINYTATTQDFAKEMRKIDRMQMERKTKGQEPLRIAVDDTSEWPCVWYFRNYEVLWKSVDLSRDIQIMKDVPENRRRIEMRRGNAWEMIPINLRGWWIWHGDLKGLPLDKNDPPTPPQKPEDDPRLSLLHNIGCFLVNCQNNHLEVFPPEKRPKPEDYFAGFTMQVLRYVFGRTIWYPEAGEKVLVCYKTDRQVDTPRTENLLEGADQAAQPITAQASWGTKGSDQKQLLEPRGLAFTPSGNLAIADSKNGSVEVFTPTGEFVSEIGKGVLSKEVSGACDVACDSEGNFYVADTWNHSIRKFSADGTLLNTANQAMQDGQRVGLFGPRGIAINSKGIVYATDTGNKYVRVYNKNLDPVFSWGGAGDESGKMNEPVGIAIDKQDRVYVADMGNGRIQRFTPEGKFEAEYATVEARDLEIVAMEPNMDILADGRLAVTFSNTGTFWVVDPEKRTVSIRQIVQPQVRLPHGVAADRDGNLWITDRDTSIITKLRVD